MGFSRYDIWKTASPYDDQEEVIAGKCSNCQTELYDGEEIYYDSRDGNEYCDKKCFKNYIKNNINDEIDHYIEMLEENKDTYETTIEADEEEL